MSEIYIDWYDKHQTIKQTHIFYKNSIHNFITDMHTSKPNRNTVQVEILARVKLSVLSYVFEY